jgi:hypothetical protein
VGSIACWSLSPLPARTTIWLLVKSTSLTLRRRHSIPRQRIPCQRVFAKPGLKCCLISLPRGFA